MPPRLLACTPGEDGVPFSSTVAGAGLGVGENRNLVWDVVSVTC